MGNISFTTAPAAIRKAMPGMLAIVLASAGCMWSYINKTPQAAQVSTITVGGATNSTDYTASFLFADDPALGTVTATYTSDASASAAEITNGLSAAINKQPQVAGRVSAASDGVSVITVTARTPGAVFTMTDNHADLTSADVTAAAVAEAIPFGRAVIDVGLDSTSRPERCCALPKSSRLTAQVDTITVNYRAAAIYEVTITVEGLDYPVVVVADTDDATTATAIRTAINAAMPANTVACTGATDQVILTAEILGTQFVTSVGTGTPADLALVHTTAGSDVVGTLGGFTVESTDEETIGIGGTDQAYNPGNSGVRVLREGKVWCPTTSTPADGASVYVETNGTSAGLLFSTSSATRVKLPKSIATWERYDAALALAVARIHLPLAA